MELEPIPQNNAPVVFQGNFSLYPKTQDKYERFISILKKVVPKMGLDEDKVIMAEVLLALKLEGIIGEELTETEEKMIIAIKDSIKLMPEKREEALMLVAKFLQ